MISKRRQITLVLGNGDIQYKTIIESDNCKKGSQESFNIINFIFRVLHETPDISMCGDLPFEEMLVTHSGDKWIIQFTAIKIKV